MTPDFLRGEAVAQIIGTMHTRPVGGPWSLISVTTVGRVSMLLFAVGTIYPDTQDDRRYVEVTVEEKPESWRPASG